MTTWVLADVALRLGTATLSFALITHLFFLNRPEKTLILMAAIALSAFHMMIESEATAPFVGNPGEWSSTIMLVEPILVVWACLVFFNDNFKPNRWQVLGAGAYFAVALAAVLGVIPAVIGNVAKFVPFTYLLYAAIQDDNDDLLEARRGFRRFFGIEVAICCIIITGLSIYCINNEPPVWLHPLIALLVFSLIATLMFWVLRVRGDLWAESVPEVTEATPPVADNGLSLSENALAVRLEKAMEAGAWRQEGLTIRILAEQLDAPEHRLRKVINQGLGYRNFSAFINERRVAAAAAAFSDPARADVPVITIAHEAGFASLGPFNRAFRELTGSSPTDYRRRAIG
jgi:AraC-like DNA-binding protein/membrane protein YdbS with pleckstrin-like domain